MTFDIFHVYRIERTIQKLQQKNNFFQTMGLEHSKSHFLNLIVPWDNF